MEEKEGEKEEREEQGTCIVTEKIATVATRITRSIYVGISQVTMATCRHTLLYGCCYS